MAAGTWRGRAARLGVRVLAVALAGWLLAVGVAWLRVLVDDDTPSRSRGSATHGSLRHGHAIPPWGRGFTTYSILGSALGRQYVHGAVRDLLVAALGVASEETGTTYVVAETGWPGGGPLWPHHSHESGTSVDLLVPVRDAESGARAMLSTAPWAQLGYGHELDEAGRLGALELDAPALAALLCALDALEEDAVSVRRVILAPELEHSVEEAMTPSCRRHLEARWEREPVWWRHDEHVHLDFRVR